MSNETKTIASAMATLKGTVTGVVTKQGDLKSGSKDGSDWTKKVFTLTDDSGSVEITAWNDEVKLFHVGHTYEIENGWWKEYEGKVGLSIGKFAKVKQIGEATTGPIPVKETPKNINEPEKLEKSVEDYVRAQARILASIQFVVKEEFSKWFIDPNNQFIGLAVKEIFRKI